MAELMKEFDVVERTADCGPTKATVRGKPDEELTARQLYLRNWWRNNREYSRTRAQAQRAARSVVESEKVRAANRDWNRNNKDKLAVSNARYAASPKGRYTTLINNAKNSNRDLELSFDEWLEIALQPCRYCGEPGLSGKSGYGIDRVDSSQGYTLSNSAPCCRDCNSMKSNLEADVFLSHVQKIAAHNAVAPSL